MKNTSTPLHPGEFYHIYNRGNNREDLFREERNYRYFLKLYAHHVYPVAETFAYCLMRNHFHLLVRIRSEKTPQVDQQQTSQVLKTCEVSKCFSNLFNAYTKAINKGYNRTGSLFEERFGRIVVDSDRYFLQLIFYIHFNPQKHVFVSDFREWPWSSYHTLQAAGETKLNRADVLGWFGNLTQFEHFHRGMVDEKAVAPVIDEELL